MNASRDPWFDSGWINGRLARILLGRGLTLPILVALRDRGVVNTSRLIDAVRGHPESVIRTLRLLEQVGVVQRARARAGRRAVEARLTLRGLELVETPVYRWIRLLRKWDLLPV